MQDGSYLIRVPVSGASVICPVQPPVTEKLLAEMLGTDVTERMRMPAAAQRGGGSVLCYFIDARGGEKNLPVNFRGTCFYHTGCPIHGDLLIARCPQNAADPSIYGLAPEQAEEIVMWISEQFPDLNDMI